MIPNIRKTEDTWEGFIELKNWEQVYGHKLEILLNIGGEHDIVDITFIHENGYNYIISNQDRILDSIFTFIFTMYPEWQDEYDYEDEEKEELMPNLFNKQELSRYLIPKKIFILDVSIENLPYIGVEFESTWDAEHGLGIMLFDGSIIAHGGNEMAFLTWVANQDKERRS